MTDEEILFWRLREMDKTDRLLQALDLPGYGD